MVRAQKETDLTRESVKKVREQINVVAFRLGQERQKYAEQLDGIMRRQRPAEITYNLMLQEVEKARNWVEPQHVPADSVVISVVKPIEVV